MQIFAGKKIVLGVTGSIAAYKACNIVRSLKKMGANVTVAMTSAAAEFVKPKTFEVLSGNKVFMDIFNDEMNHVELARQNDLFVIAPITANTLAKLANGFADDAVSTMFLSSQCPILLCPAMHTDMWQNAAVRENVLKLKERGVNVLGPEIGELSMGDYGEGRLIDENMIVDYMAYLLTPRSLSGRTVMITVGPTFEAIDRVRFISNKSSGKMGIALVKELYLRGANIKLISSFSRERFVKTWDDRLEFIQIVSAEDMLKEVVAGFASVDTVISVAAVADFRPETVYDGKLPKTAVHSLSLKLNEDILQHLSTRKEGRKLVGFVLQDSFNEVDVLAKIEKKGLDICLAVSDEALGADKMSVNLFIGSQKEAFWELPKVEIAKKLIELL